MPKSNDPKAVFDKLVKELSDKKSIGKGQHFLHELPVFRDWEIALNVIHLALVSQPSYIGIVTNTRRQLNGITKDINFERKKEDISEELKSLLRIKSRTFTDLAVKIKEKQLTTDSDKDIWLFSTPWREFAEGTKVISLHQRFEARFKKKTHKYRRAFVILDQKCSIASQNKMLYIIDRILDDEKNIKRILKIAAYNFVKRPARKKAKKKYVGRLPGRLVLLLKNQFATTIATVSEDERRMLKIYFQMLKDLDEYNKSHADIEQRLGSYFNDVE